MRSWSWTATGRWSSARKPAARSRRRPSPTTGASCRLAPPWSSTPIMRPSTMVPTTCGPSWIGAKSNRDASRLGYRGRRRLSNVYGRGEFGALDEVDTASQTTRPSCGNGIAFRRMMRIRLTPSGRASGHWAPLREDSRELSAQRHGDRQPGGCAAISRPPAPPSAQGANRIRIRRIERRTKLILALLVAIVAFTLAAVIQGQAQSLLADLAVFFGFAISGVILMLYWTANLMLWGGL